jgi:IS605 OrfB family transposase
MIIRSSYHFTGLGYSSLTRTKVLVRTFDLIVLEDLNVSGMLKNRKLSKSILDASWPTFVSMLNYKCNWYGKVLVTSSESLKTSLNKDAWFVGAFQVGRSNSPLIK